MGLRERLTQVTQFFRNARIQGRQLRDDEERGEPQAPSPGDQSSQHEERRLAGMTAEDREWEQASQQRDRDRHARLGDAPRSSEEPQISAEDPRNSAGQ